MIYVDSKDMFIAILDTDESAFERTRRLKPPWYKVERMATPLDTKRKTSLSWLPLNKSLLKPFFMLCGMTLVICACYIQRTSILDNGNIHIDRSRHSRHRATIRQSSSSVPKKKERENAWRPGKKIFIAFDYWEQLSMATNNFLDLTALAAYAGRQVVVPFVKDSRFYGAPRETGFETLALYYNVSALNRTLRSRGHGTLISWKEFQDVCQGKLDLLVHFEYTKLRKSKKYNRNTRAFFPCNDHHGKTFGDLKAERTICMNVFAVDSVRKFEFDVIERLPCIGLAEWRGSNNERSYRAQFNLSATVKNRLHFRDATIFFSSKLLQVARDFVTKSLSPFFVSAHIRAEKMLKFGTTFQDSAAVKECILNLTTLVQRYKNTSTVPITLFLATDFADYGSSSYRAIVARNNAKSLMKILIPLKPIVFQPSTYNLTDRGAVSIVELNILVSSKRIFVVGGGSFQTWLAEKFLNYENHSEHKSIAKCRNELCNNLCYL